MSAKPLIILTYHRIGAQRDFVSDVMGAGVSAEHFTCQMEFLSRHCEVLSLADAVQRMRQHSSHKKPLAVVTLDDGYKDNHDAAWPVLKKYKLPATIFAVAGHMGSGKLIWQHRLYYLRAHGGDRRLLQAMRGYSASTQESFSGLMQWFKTQGDLAQRDVLIDRLWHDAGLSASQERELAAVLYLSWEQMRAMAADGIEFGSHTRTHPMLSSIPVEILHGELRDSKRMLEEQLGKAVQSFAYPYGHGDSFSDATVEAVRQAGYKAACIWQWGVNTAGSFDAFRLKRKGINYAHRFPMWLEISGIKDRLRKWAGVEIQ